MASKTFGLHDQPVKHKREYPESPKLWLNPIRVQRQDPVSGGPDPKLKEDATTLHQVSHISVATVSRVSSAGNGILLRTIGYLHLS
jgi:hypothetical protein